MKKELKGLEEGLEEGPKVKIHVDALRAKLKKY